MAELNLNSRLGEHSKNNISLKNHHFKHSLKEIHDQLFPYLRIRLLTGNVPFNRKRFYDKALWKDFGISRNEERKCTEIYKCHDLID